VLAKYSYDAMISAGETVRKTLASASSNQQSAVNITWHGVRHIATANHAYRWAGAQPEVDRRPTAG